MQNNMNRRDALSRVALLLGGTIISTNLFISGCQSDIHHTNDLFDKNGITLLNEIADTILPATDTPGAKDANVGHFMAVMVRDCYDAGNQQIFMKGLNAVNKKTYQKFKQSFTHAEPQQRLIILEQFEQGVKAHNPASKAPDMVQFYRMVKELTLLGYFTSEQGCTQALRYVPVPGRYDGDYPYGWGDKAWALT